MRRKRSPRGRRDAVGVGRDLDCQKECVLYAVGSRAREGGQGEVETRSVVEEVNLSRVAAVSDGGGVDAAGVDNRAATTDVAPHSEVVVRQGDHARRRRGVSTNVEPRLLGVVGAVDDERLVVVQVEGVGGRLLEDALVSAFGASRRSPTRHSRRASLPVPSIAITVVISSLLEQSSSDVCVEQLALASLFAQCLAAALVDEIRAPRAGHRAAVLLLRQERLIDEGGIDEFAEGAAASPSISGS